MIVELLYTSAPQGLKQGSRGFCTVLSTEGLPLNLAQRLEALSVYRHIYPPGDPKADANPVCFSHLRFVVGGKHLSVISRIAAYGFDYSQRSNKIAHHIVLDEPQLYTCGPAALALQPGLLRSQWDGQCRTLPSAPKIQEVHEPASVCKTWLQVTGDAGWAGVLADAWLKSTPKPTWIIFSESQSALLPTMMREAIALLPERKRWSASFSTYCTNLPPDVDCKIRCVLAGSDEARLAPARGQVIDLTKPLSAAPMTPECEAARNGTIIGGESPSPSKSTAPKPAQPVNENALSPRSLPPSAADIDEYELSESDVVAVPQIRATNPPRPQTPSPVPTRPLVVPKHYKEPVPLPATASSNSPILFLSIAAGIVLLAGVIATTFLLNGPSKDEQASANNQPNDDSPEQLSPEPTPPPATKQPIISSEEHKEQPKVKLTLVCSPTSVELEENQLEAKPLTQIKLSTGTFERSKLIIESELTRQLEIKDDGHLLWNGPAPKIEGDEKVFEIKLAYKFDDGNMPTTNFKLKILNHDDSNLKIKLVRKDDAKLSHLTIGSAISSQIEGEDEDETGALEERMVQWQAKQASGSWQSIGQGTNYEVKLEDIGKSIRALLSYKTNNNQGKTEVASDPIEVIGASSAKIGLTESLTTPFQVQSLQLNLRRPALAGAPAPVVSYGVAKQEVAKDSISLKSSKLLTAAEIERVDQALKPLRDADAAFRQRVFAVATNFSQNQGWLVFRKKMFPADVEYSKVESRLALLRASKEADKVLDELALLAATLEVLKKDKKDIKRDDRKDYLALARKIYPQLASAEEFTPTDWDSLTAFASLVSQSKPTWWNDYITTQKTFWSEVEKAMKYRELFQCLEPFEISKPTKLFDEKVQATCRLAFVLEFDYPSSLPKELEAAGDKKPKDTKDRKESKKEL